MSERTHLSRVPIDQLHDAEPYKDDPYFKPAGLWYEVDGDWQRWMRDEEWTHNKYRLLYALRIDPACDFVVIRSVHGFDAFHDRYKTSPYPGSRRDYIDWPRVMQEHDGIEIAPYLWERRLQGNASAWYYWWDCASGALWRPRASTLRLITDAWRLDAHIGRRECHGAWLDSPKERMR